MQEAADMLGVNYFSIYRLIQRSKLKVCHALRGKLLVQRTELLKAAGNRMDQPIKIGISNWPHIPLLKI
ncbi:MAG: hypothetical protein ACREDS_01460 [Limisphaerales bacterium]